MSRIKLSFERRPVEEVAARAQAVHRAFDSRRSVRVFSADPVPRAIIEELIRAASTAPSGAHRQPWTFVAVSDPAIKSRIRQAAEAEERRNYEGGRMPEAWLEALRPLGTDAVKPYLEVAPWLVVVFAQNQLELPDGSRTPNYYVKESVGIACGLFIAAVHQAGLATLTHTPSPMGFLSEILGRPSNEKALILFPVGYPAADVTVPDIARKPLEEVAVFFEAEEG
jgi:nitroreductase